MKSTAGAGKLPLARQLPSFSWDGQWAAMRKDSTLQLMYGCALLASLQGSSGFPHINAGGTLVGLATETAMTSSYRSRSQHSAIATSSR